MMSSGGPEDMLQRELEALGPVMLRQEQAEAELSPGFAAQLRTRLVGDTQPVTDLRRLRLAVMAGTIGTIAAAVVLALTVSHRSGSRVSAFARQVPYPARQDLLFSLPSPLTVVHRLLPTQSLVRPAPAVPYPGRLTLIGSPPARQPALRAYRLAPRTDIALFRRLLGIRAPSRRLKAGGDVWLVASDGGPGTGRPLHSVAVSLGTGQLIYHDRRNFVLPRAHVPPAPAAAIRAARTWLGLLGWPGGRMPVESVGPAPGRGKVRQVVFGWSGLHGVAVPQATLWVTPDRSIVEAWLWPPVRAGGSVPSVSLPTAWTKLRAGRLPLVVAGVRPGTQAPGDGVLRQTAAVLIPSSGGPGKAYLVPAYRFSGRVRLQSSSHSYPWYGLAPGQSK